MSWFEYTAHTYHGDCRVHAWGYKDSSAVSKRKMLTNEQEHVPDDSNRKT